MAFLEGCAPFGIQLDLMVTAIKFINYFGLRQMLIAAAVSFNFKRTTASLPGGTKVIKFKQQPGNTPYAQLAICSFPNN